MATPPAQLPFRFGGSKPKHSRCVSHATRFSTTATNWSSTSGRGQSYAATSSRHRTEAVRTGGSARRSNHP